jgi:hypothetical protein
MSATCQPAASGRTTDPRLEFLIAAWADLPEAVRETVLLVVEAATSNGRGRRKG